MIRFVAPAPAPSSSLPGRVLRAVLRVALLVLGAVITLVLLAVGLLLALGLVLWALLRGRRPVVAPAFSWARRNGFAGPGRARPQAAADVVDIEAREVRASGDPSASAAATPPPQLPR